MKSHAADSMPLLSLCDVCFTRENRVILDHVNFTINHGDFVAVTGPNGGGKTTLLRIILGLVAPTAGKVIHFDTTGNPVPSVPMPGYLPQKNSVDSHFPISVREVIASGLLSDKNISKIDKEKRIEEVLEIIDMKSLADRAIGRLSGGQLQRTLFGRAIVSKPSVLILDEPLSYLDKHFEEHLYTIIEKLAEHTTIILVSHQMNHISGMANRHIIIDRTLTECNHAHHFASECND